MIEAGVLIAAGVIAGVINTVVGSGSLVTFPALLTLGYSPLTANVTSTVGMMSGSVSGTIGYRRELSGQRKRGLRLGSAACLGSLCGAGLLLLLPSAAFESAIPFLVLAACILVAIQDRIARITALGFRAHDTSLVLLGTVFLTGVYGGYFGAAQGVILMALLAIFTADGLQRLNALKNFLAIGINGVAALAYVFFFAPIAWPAALMIAIGATIGGQLGAALGRRLSNRLLRSTIIAMGLVVSARLLFNTN